MDELIRSGKGNSRRGGCPSDALLYVEEIEQAVLGACLLEREAQRSVMGKIRAEMFYVERHRLIFNTVERLFREGKVVDILTVTEGLRVSGELEEAGGPYEVARLTMGLATAAHLEEHCLILFQYYVRRQLVELLQRKLAEAGDLTFDLYETMKGVLEGTEGLMERNPWQECLHPMEEVMELTWEQVQRRQASSDAGVTGVPTGLAQLDLMTGGWQPGELIFTAARPGDGKTALDLFFARVAARSGRTVLFATLEMRAAELGERMMLAESGVDAGRLKRGVLTAEELGHLERVKEEMKGLPVLVDDTPYVSVDHLCALVKRQAARQRLGLIIVDYLQLLGAGAMGGSRTREQEVAECSRKLKLLARQTGCPVIVSSQLNRQAETQVKRPELHHLRESGAIEQDADLVIMLYRPERFGLMVDVVTRLPAKGLGIAVVAKHRHGATGEVYYRYNESMTEIQDFIVNG